jgi:hypothetical protein
MPRGPAGMASTILFLLLQDHLQQNLSDVVWPDAMRVSQILATNNHTFTMEKPEDYVCNFFFKEYVYSTTTSTILFVSVTGCTMTVKPINQH